jgi:tetratricopeptide (TPR) repeat protein
VRYVIEGSVRRSGEKLRITGQLIDAASGNHIWADRFEGETSDVFALQDRFAESVAATVEPRLRLAEMQRLKHKPAGDLNAYDLLLRAQQSIYEWTAESLEAAMRSLEQALALDPNYSLASATLANCYSARWSEGWAKDRRAESAEGLRLIARALEFGKDDGEVLWRAALGTLQLAVDVPRATELVYRALDVNPNSSIALAIAGWIETLSGNHDKALELFDRAQRLSPRDPRAWMIESGISHARYHRREFAESLAFARKALSGNPRLSSALVMQVASLGMLGEKAKAAAALIDARKLDPDPTISKLRARAMFSQEQVWREIAEGLRRAGMPE